MKPADNTPFYLTYSKLSCGFIIAMYVFTGLLMLMFGLPLSVLAVTGESLNLVMLIAASSFLAVTAACFAFAVFIFRNVQKGTPLAIITSEGFSGRRNFRWKEYPWTPNTYLYYGMSYGGARTQCLVNPPEEFAIRETLSEFVVPKNAISLKTVFAEQTLQDVEAAVARLNPYYTPQASYSMFKNMPFIKTRSNLGRG